MNTITKLAEAIDKSVLSGEVQHIELDDVRGVEGHIDRIVGKGNWDWADLGCDEQDRPVIDVWGDGWRLEITRDDLCRKIKTLRAIYGLMADLKNPHAIRELRVKAKQLQAEVDEMLEV